MEDKTYYSFSRLKYLLDRPLYFYAPPKIWSPAMDWGTAFESVLNGDTSAIGIGTSSTSKGYQLARDYPKDMEVSAKNVEEYLQDKDYYKNIAMEKRVDKFIKDYGKQIETLRQGVVVSQEDYDTIMDTAKYVKTLPKAKDMIGGSKQLYLEAHINDVPVKGYLDYLWYDDRNIYVADLKTSNQPLKKFATAIDDYHYDLQLYIYGELVKKNITAIINDEKQRTLKRLILYVSKEYKYESTYIEIDDMGIYKWVRIVKELIRQQQTDENKYVPSLANNGYIHYKNLCKG